MKFLSFLTQRDVLVLDYQHGGRDVTCKPAIGHFRVPPGLCIKTRLSAQPLIWKSFFILRQIKLILTRKVVYLASFWKWGFLELGSGLFPKVTYVLFPLQTSTLPPSPALAHFFLFEKSLGRVIVRIISSFQSHPYSISCNYSNELTCVSKWAVTLQAD